MRIHKRTTKRIVLLVALISVAAAASTLARRAASESVRQPARAEALQLHEAAAQPPSRRQVVRVWVHADDIYPSFVRIRPGKVLLLCENETQVDVSLVVEKADTGKPRQGLGNLPTPQLDKRAKQEIELGAGRYEFYSAARPDVRGVIIVDPKMK